MRLLLLALMIALLPVRGWMGNAMAIEAAMQQVAITQSLTEGAAPVLSREKALVTSAVMPEDCLMSVQHKSGKSVEDDQANETGASCNCNSCELCLALANFTFSTMATVTFTPHAETPSHGTRFSNAECGFSLKPPIS